MFHSNRQLSPHKHYETSTLCMNKRKLFILDIITLNHLQELSSTKSTYKIQQQSKKTLPYQTLNHNQREREREREKERERERENDIRISDTKHGAPVYITCDGVLK